MRISILGCGWLGFPLAKALVQDEHAIKGSTTRESRLKDLQKAGIHPFLIRLSPELEGKSSFFDADLIIINIPPRNQGDQPDYHERQLRSIREEITKHKISKVIFVSSTSVYPNLNRVVHESDADPNAVSRGGISLVKMEELFTSSKEFKTTVLRFGGLYGPDRHPGRFLAGRKNLSGGSNPVNMIHLEDCIGIIKTIIGQNAWGDTYNACSPNHPTRQEFYHQAAVDLGMDPPTFSAEKNDFKEVSSQKLIRKLDYRFVH